MVHKVGVRYLLDCIRDTGDDIGIITLFMQHL